MRTEFDNISFDMPKLQSNSIKVIGVGGGGSNAVNHMFQQDIKGVDFVICNTDAQALQNSSVPNKIQLGADLTSGLGAGANPEVGAQAARESIKEIQETLNIQTKMVFITAGMGGGTGTGAAPIIAKTAKDMDILTVGIVTMPFQFEGRMRSKQAQIGVDQLRSSVDSLIIINNNKLREVYGNLGFKAGFSKADEVLSTAARGIAEVITHHYKQNIDLHDAKTVLSNSGTAIMGSSKDEGVDRAKNAIIKALDSPLLNDNKITGAKNVLLLIVSGTNEVTLDEIGEINDFIQAEAGFEVNIIMGIGEDHGLGDAISVTIVATGFPTDQQSNITNTEVKKIVHTLEDEQEASYNFPNSNLSSPYKMNKPVDRIKEKRIHVVNREDSQEMHTDLIPTSELIKNIQVIYDEIEIDNISEEDFIITEISSEIKEDSIKSTPPSADLSFDLSLNDSKNQTSHKTKIPHREDSSEKLDTDSNIEYFRAKKEESTKKRYFLDDFDTKSTSRERAEVRKEKPIEEELLFELKSRSLQSEMSQKGSFKEEISPESLSISELKERIEQRRKKIQVYNHRFTDHMNRDIDEIERQPAYKRLGVNLDDINSNISKSKTILNTDDNETIQLKSKNSFLHDNVD